MIARRHLALLAVGLLLSLLLRPLVADTLAEPLRLLYVLARGYLESLPQIYLWAALLGIFAWLGLRRWPIQAQLESSPSRSATERRSRLGAWHRLLADRHRGAYFEWRLAHRLAALERWIGATDAMEQPMRRYLQIGRDQRTIRAEPALSGLNLELERLVGYLEDALNRS